MMNALPMQYRQSLASANSDDAVPRFAQCALVVINIAVVVLGIVFFCDIFENYGFRVVVYRKRAINIFE